MIGSFCYSAPCKQLPTFCHVPASLSQIAHILSMYLYSACGLHDSQAISEMLPRSGESDLSEPAAVDGKMACIGNTNSYLPCAKRSVQLNSVLDAVKDNLHREQKRVMEMKFVVVHRVLSPIQVCALLYLFEPAVLLCFKA